MVWTCPGNSCPRPWSSLSWCGGPGRQGLPTRLPHPVVRCDRGLAGWLSETTQRALLDMAEPLWENQSGLGRGCGAPGRRESPGIAELRCASHQLEPVWLLFSLSRACVKLLLNLLISFLLHLWGWIQEIYFSETEQVTGYKMDQKFRGLAVIKSTGECVKHD